MPLLPCWGGSEQLGGYSAAFHLHELPWDVQARQDEEGPGGAVAAIVCGLESEGACGVEQGV